MVTFPMVAFVFAIFSDCNHFAPDAALRLTDARHHFAYHLFDRGKNDGLLVGWPRGLVHPPYDEARDRELVPYEAAAFGKQLSEMADRIERQLRSGELQFSSARADRVMYGRYQKMISRMGFYAVCSENIIDCFGHLVADSPPGEMTKGKAHLARARIAIARLSKHFEKEFYRVYTHGPGSYRPRYQPDPSKEINWIDVGGPSHGGIGHSVSGGGGSVSIHPGGRIGFVDGAVLSFESITIHRSLGREGRIESVDAR